MLMFSAESIRQKPAKGVDAMANGPQFRACAFAAHRPFLPGQVYLIRFMENPTIITVLARSDTTVTWWYGEESINRFNARTICYLGYRASIGPFWLPFARIAPRLLINDMPLSKFNDSKFWSTTDADLAAADAQPAPERNGLTQVPNGVW